MIDFNTRFASYKHFESLAGHSPLNGDLQDKFQEVRDRGVEIPSGRLEDHVERWNTEFDRFAVSHFGSFGSVEEAPELEQAASLFKGRMLPFAPINPLLEDAAQTVLDLIQGRGFAGLLLYPSVHGYSMRDPRIEPVLKVMHELNAICVVHSGLMDLQLFKAFDLPTSFDVELSNPLHLVPAAGRFERIRFVIPSFGGGFLRETLMAGSLCKNLRVDSSSCNEWLQTQAEQLSLADVFERVLHVFGARRILFGSGSSVFPRGWRAESVTLQREALGACGVSAESREWIFNRNALELFHLDDGEKSVNPDPQDSLST